jgi:hypothetical protein
MANVTPSHQSRQLMEAAPSAMGTGTDCNSDRVVTAAYFDSFRYGVAYIERTGASGINDLLVRSSTV